MRGWIAGFFLLGLTPAYGAAPVPNAAGRWSFGYGVTGGSFTPYPNIFPNDGGVTGWTVRSIDGNIPYTSHYSGERRAYMNALLVPDWVIMSPGPVAGATVDTVVRWTPAAAGTYSFTGYFEILSAKPTGVQALIFKNADNWTEFAIHSGNGALSKPGAKPAKLKPGANAYFEFNATLANGDVMSFGVNSAGSYYNDVTGLKVRVVATGGAGTQPE